MCSKCKEERSSVIYHRRPSLYPPPPPLFWSCNPRCHKGAHHHLQKKKTQGTVNAMVPKRRGTRTSSDVEKAMCRAPECLCDGPTRPRSCVLRPVTAPEGARLRLHDTASALWHTAASPPSVFFFLGLRYTQTSTVHRLVSVCRWVPTNGCRISSNGCRFTKILPPTGGGGTPRIWTPTTPPPHSPLAGGPLRGGKGGLGEGVPGGAMGGGVWEGPVGWDGVGWGAQSPLPPPSCHPRHS